MKYDVVCPTIFFGSRFSFQINLTIKSVRQTEKRRTNSEGKAEDTQSDQPAADRQRY